MITVTDCVPFSLLKSGIPAKTDEFEFSKLSPFSCFLFQAGTKIGPDHLGSDRITSPGRINSDRLKIMKITKRKRFTHIVG